LQDADPLKLRLDRLITLLDTGTTSSVRLTAARQLGQLAGTRVSHPSSNDHYSSEIKVEGDVKGVEKNDGIWSGVDGEWNDVLQLVARVSFELFFSSSSLLLRQLEMPRMHTRSYLTFNLDRQIPVKQRLQL